MRLVKLFNTARIACMNHKDEILTGVSITSYAAATGLTAREAVRAIPDVKEFRENFNTIKECRQRGWTLDENGAKVEYTKSEAAHDVFVCYCQTGGKMIRRFALPVGLFGLGAGLQIKVFGNQNKKIGDALVKASIAESTLATYRQNVIDMDGELKDAEYMSGHKFEEGTISIEKDPETGDTIISSAFDDIPFQPDSTPLDRDWGEGCFGWYMNDTEDLNVNINTLYNFQAEFGDILENTGVVTVKDIYDKLNLPYSREDLSEDEKKNLSKLLNNYGWTNIPGMDRPGGEFIDFGVIEYDEETGLPRKKKGCIILKDINTKRTAGIRLSFSACPPKPLYGAAFENIDKKYKRGMRSKNYILEQYM